MDEIEYLNIDDDSTGNQSYNQMSNQDNTTLDATSDSPPGLKIKERGKFPSNWACTSTRGSDELEDGIQVTTRDNNICDAIPPILGR